MRKFTFLAAALAFVAGGANAQIEFVHNDEIVENGATVVITELHALSETYFQVKSDVMLKNIGEEETDYTLTITLQENNTSEEFSCCGFGTCVSLNLGIPLKNTGTLYSNELKDPQVDVQGFWDPANAAQAVFLYELTYGDVTKTITVEIDYDPTVSIDDVNAEKSVFVADNEVVYSFDAPAARQLNVYSVTGALVKQEVLETAGTVSLNALGKGIYLYEVVENGERVSAHKCVVR